MGQRHKTLSSETHTHQHLTHVAAGLGIFFFPTPTCACVSKKKKGGGRGAKRGAFKNYNSSLKRTTRPPPSSRSPLSSSPTRRVSMSYTSE